MDYNFNEVEKKWQEYWRNNNVYKVDIDKNKPKFYILDMFPYPSGAGLHVGHPLGYIASDIYARYKRLKGFNVLHPMGYDAYGLPAEQYAIDTGNDPRDFTKRNINTFKRQEWLVHQKINKIDSEGDTVIQVLVPNECMSVVIGKGGNIANSIRTIVQAAAYNKKLGKVRINIDSL